MGADYPDWGGQYNSQQFYPLFDMAELAARLGSLVTYDRRGSVIWTYDFRHGITGTGFVATGTGSVVFLSNLLWETPPFSLVLQAGSDDGAEAYIHRRLAVPQSKKVGFQASLRAGTGADELYINIWHYTGSTLFYSYLIADMDAATLKVATGNSDFVTLDSAFPDLTTGFYFSHFKLVCNLEDHTLMRAMVDDNEYDLSQYTMKQQVSALAPHLYVRVSHINHNLANATLNVDNLIVTAAEPDN